MTLQSLLQEQIEKFDSFWELQFPNSHPAEYGITKKFLIASLTSSILAAFKACEVEDRTLGDGKPIDVYKPDIKMMYAFNEANAERRKKEKEFMNL